MGGGRWRDRENHHPAEQPFRETEWDVGTGGLKPCSAHCLIPARGLRAVLRVVSCRTATVWKTLCPFWGEEYQVHLPPTFHSVAFYVMDEDALRWVEPRSLPGPHPPVPLWDCGSLCLLFTAWKEGEPRGTCRVWGLDVQRLCPCMWVHCAPTPSHVRVSAGLCVHGDASLETGTWREELGM